MDKRAQGLPTNAIILIVLGVVVLVVLIVGFTIGWDKFAPWLSGNNVDTIVTQCNTACATGGVSAFCNEVREVKFSGELRGTTLQSGAKKTCSELVNENIGVDKCDTISCGPVNVPKTCAELKGTLSEEECSGDTPKDISDKATDTDGEKKFCCVAQGYIPPPPSVPGG